MPLPLTNPAEPAAWLWTLRVDDEYLPGGSGGRKVMQTPSFCDCDDDIIREVEGRWKTKVVDVVKKEALYVREP